MTGSQTAIKNLPRRGRIVSILADRLVSVTDYARDFPRVASFPPNHGELKGAAVIFPMLLVAESMFADLDRPVIFDWINLEASFHEIPADVGVDANILLKPSAFCR